MKVLDIAIGLVLVYFLYSLLISLLAEMLSTWFGWRARLLRQAIQNLLTGRVRLDRWKSFVEWIKDVLLVEPLSFKTSKAAKFYNQPEIKSLAKKSDNEWYSIRNTKPSYISPSAYSRTIIAMLCEKSEGVTLWERVKHAIETNVNGFDESIHKKFQNYLNQCSGDYDKFVAILEDEFNQMMDRITGWYKRKIGFVLFWLGFIVCLIGNVDTIKIVKSLSNNEKSRAEMLSLAIRNIKIDSTLKEINHPADTAADQQRLDTLQRLYRDVYKEIESSRNVLAMGWDFNPVIEKVVLDTTKIMKAYRISKDSIDKILKNEFHNDSLQKYQIFLSQHFSSENKPTKCNYLSLDSLSKSNSLWFSKPPSFGSKVCQVKKSLTENPIFFLGIMLSAFALSLGANFWFDLLKKLVSIRGAGIKPDESSHESHPQLGINTSSREKGGSEPLTDDIYDLVISKNKQRWNQLPGISGINRRGELIEFAFDKSVPNDIQNLIPLPITENGIQINISTVIRNKGTFDFASKVENPPKNALLMNSTNIYGTATGLVWNSVTRNEAILTAGHVVLKGTEVFFEQEQHAASMYDGSDFVRVGFLSNKIISAYFDAGLIDVVGTAYNNFNLKPLDKIHLFNSNDINTGGFIIHTNHGDIECKLEHNNIKHKFAKENEADFYFFKLLVFKLENGRITQKGDSGALITKNQIPFAMHIGGGYNGDQYHSYALALADIFEALQLRPVNLGG